MSGGRGKYGSRTSARFESLRYWLMWRIAPVSAQTVRHALLKEVESWDEDEYDRHRMLAHLLGLFEDRYFDTDVSGVSGDDDRKRPDIKAQVAFKGDFTDKEASEKNDDNE